MPCVARLPALVLLVLRTMHIVHELIDPDADKVVRRLSSAGYQAYLVGGCVRDLLLNRNPKDFDVSSSATPQEIKQLFRNCRIIGRRFRLAHIFFGSKIIETATFRANPRPEKEDGSELLIHRDNVWGTDTEDAKRRDFTINGLFYDVEAELVIDHVHGLDDLKKRLIRTIGVPDIRFQEDPVRIMRAIKFAARLGFDVEEETYKAIIRHRADIKKCSQPRVLEELYRLLLGGAARRSMEILADTGVASCLSPHLGKMYAAKSDTELAQAADSQPRKGSDDWAAGWAQEEESTETQPDHASYFASFTNRENAKGRLEFAWNILGQLDRLIAEERPTSNALAVAALVAAFVVPDLVQEDRKPQETMAMIDEVLQPLISQIGITRRDSERAVQILQAQTRLHPSRKKRSKPMALVKRDSFSESLALYKLMARAEGKRPAELEFWRKLQSESGIDPDASPERKRRRGGRRRRRVRPES